MWKTTVTSKVKQQRAGLHQLRLDIAVGRAHKTIGHELATTLRANGVGQDVGKLPHMLVFVFLSTLDITMHKQA